MKKVIVSLFVLICILGKKELHAQMGAAQQIKWDVVKDVDCNMSPDVVWNFLNDTVMLKRASNGYVTSIKTTDPTSRIIVFSNGSTRSENILQSEKENKIMVMDINKESLPQGITSEEIAIFVKGDDKKSTITWRAKIEGNKEGKQTLINQLKAEFDDYAIGFEKIAENTIPAATMN